MEHLKHLVNRCREFVSFNKECSVGMSGKRAFMRLITPYANRKFLKARNEKCEIIGNLVNDGFAQIQALEEGIITNLQDSFVKHCSKNYDDKIVDLASLRYFLSTSGIQRSRPLLAKDNHLLNELWHKEEHLSLAEKYLGISREQLHGVASIDGLVSVSEEHADNSLNALEWHRDVDHFRFIKVFYYLTDCIENGGHHEFILGTHIETPLSLAPIHRYSEDALRDSLGELRKISVKGPAGSGFAEDTFGFHRGTPINSGIRLLMQFQYYPKNISWGNELTPTCESK